MKKSILLLFAALLPLVTNAHDFEVNGIYYNITSETDHTAEVTYKGEAPYSYYDEYSGSITIPATVTHNGVAYSVTSIGYEAFRDCSSLTAINIPEGVTSIGEYAFLYCTRLTTINIPEGVTSIGTSAFSGTAWYDNQPDGVIYAGRVLYKYKGTMPANTSVEVKEGTVSIGEYAFSYCSSLTAINIPESVTSIGDWAFQYCSSLTAINIPESVTSIGEYAFQYCTRLTTINIPENSQLTSIGEYAFYRCSSLTAITLPESVTSIGNQAFGDCSSLTSINIPEGVTSIGDKAFYGCSSLKTVINYSDLPLQRGSSGYGYVAYYADRVINTDEVIDDYAFKTIEGVHYLTGYIGDKTELTLPADYKGENYQIGEGAFYECSSLTTITIPEGVTSIKNSAFSYCISLTTINIPEGVTSIGGSAFSYCSSLTTINIPEGVTSIENWAFHGCSSLTAITIPENSQLTSIGNSAFLGCSSLTAITIPEGVTSIGEWAFKSCSDLTAITLPESVTSIGKYAFYKCSSLTAITIPEGVTSIGDEAFYGCSSLTAITIPESVTSIGGYTFSGCSSLIDITLPEGVTSIEFNAFDGCSSLTAITIPEGVTSIGSSAFYNCSSLKTVINYSDLPLQRGSSGYGYVAYYADRVINIDEVIDDYAFKTIEGVHYLTGYIGDKTELTLPADYKGENYQIGERAFYKCSSLTAINIPEVVTSIGEYAFYNCSSLTAITIPEGVTSIGEWAFSSCSDLTAITLPESVTSIGDEAFYGCSSLESLHIGPNVDSYGSKAFAGCTAIKELTVMGNVMPEIPSENLTSITLYSPIPLETKEFASKVYRNATLNIPEGSLTRYQNADVWKNFWYINEFDPKKGKDVYLTINQADNGYVKQHLTEGTVCTFTIVAAEGWKIHSVTFNGEEVTAQLTEEGIFTTPALQADAVLNIAYEKTEDNTMVENTTARRIKVQGHRGTLRITGATEGDDISVYTTGGTLVAQESAEDDETLITLPTGQVYLVHIGDKVVKIGM